MALPLLPTLRSLIRRRRLEAELDEELHDHLAREIAHRIGLGMSAEEARRTALAELGGVERVKDELREAHGVDRFDGLVRDLRHAARRVRRAPLYTTAVVLTIGLGIGAGTAVFSAVDGILLKPLPYADAGQLVTLSQTKLAEGIERDEVSPANFLDWRERARSFAAMAAAADYGVNLRTERSTEHTEAWLVTEGFLQLTGVAPLHGRAFLPEDFRPGATPVAILDHGFWQRRLGGARGAVGTPLNLDGRPVTVVGVMPRGCELPGPSGMWIPWAMDEEERTERFGTYLKVFGRLRPGVSLAAARAETGEIAHRLEREHRRANAGVGIAVDGLGEVLVGGRRRLLWTLLAASAALVLVTLANVAALHLTRLARQRREASVCAALGASRLRLARPLIAEAVLLAALGGLAGVALGWVGVRALQALAPPDLPRLSDVRLDWRAAGAAAVAAVGAALTLGFLSVARLGQARGSGALGSRTVTGGRASLRSRQLAVAAQLALALVLLTGTSLLVNSFLRVLSAERGYRTDHVLSFSVWVYDEYAEEAARRRFVDTVLARLVALPGVRSAAVSSALPLADPITGEQADVVPEGSAPAPGEEPQARAIVVSPDYFKTLGIPLRRGRLLGDSDDANGQRVILVNESFARRFFAGRDPLGRTVGVGLMGRSRPRLVVGVVADTRHARLDASPEPGVFIPWAQQPLPSLTFVMRTDVEPASLAQTVRRAMFEIDPRVGVARVATLDTLLAERLRERRFLLVLLATFAAIAVALASVGVFGVMSQAVVDRARETGVRMALGGAPAAILRQFMGEASRLLVVGVAVGLLMAALATRALSSFLYGVGAFDALSVTLAVALVAALALLAAAMPTWHAARLDPVRALAADG